MFAPPVTTLVEAAERLGWSGDVVGPVAYGGARFWAVAQVTPADCSDEGRPSVHITGCLFTGPARPDLLCEASLLAAYAPRAVLVQERGDLTGLLVDAAILDQGVVAVGPEGVRLLASAGPRVAPGPASPREQQLLDCVYSAWRAGQVATVA
jgi:hypothetical protein